MGGSLVVSHGGHLLRPEDVYVEMCPAGYATPVLAGFHVDPSIATPRHRADPVHKDTACWPIDSGTAQRLVPQTKSDSSPIAVGPIACLFPYRSSPATWILPCTHVKRDVWTAHHMFSPDSVNDPCPDWFNFIPDMPRLKSPAFSSHEDFSRHLIGYNLLGLLQRPHIDAHSYLF